MRRVQVTLCIALSLTGTTASAGPADADRPPGASRERIRALSGVHEGQGDAIVEMRDGRLTARISQMSLGELKRRIEQLARVSIRISQPELAAYRISGNVERQSLSTGVAHLLQSFNYTQFRDDNSGIVTFVVSSVADQNAAVAPRAGGDARESKPVLLPVAITAKAGDRVFGSPRGVDDVKRIKPMEVPAPYMEQSQIRQEELRVQEEKLLRARTILGTGQYSLEMQQQALKDVVGVDDPRTLQSLGQVLQDSRVTGNPLVAQAVAEAVWRHAAYLGFANAEANGMLQTLARSEQPQYRGIGQQALRDLENYRAKDPTASH